jgi:NADPH2:quinone reductase
VLIKVYSAALNPSDILFMKGKYKVKLPYPYTPGWEGSGTVVAVGPGLTTSWLLGRRVAFMKKFELATYQRGGTFAEYCVTDFKSCIPLADDINFEQAASFYVNPLTAVGMVERMLTLKAKACIITAAASQIGRMLIKLCNMNGITPICTVRRPEQAEML